MSSPSHSPLALEDLVEREDRLRGRLDAAEFDARLAAALDRDRVEGEVTYDFDFQRINADGIGVSGRLHARLRARCQRCLEPFDLELETSPRLLISVSESASTPEDGWELAEFGALPTLAEIIEEELLLGLPFAPRHPAAQCPQHEPAAGAARAGTQRPFSGLAQALDRRRDRAGD